MMVVMPAFAQSDQRDKPIIATVVRGIVIAIAKQVRERVHGPGHVPDYNSTNKDAPNHEAGSKLNRLRKGSTQKQFYREAN